jgi:hypothetical protein
MTQVVTETPVEDSVEPPASTESTPPGWLRFVALATAAGVLAFGAVGLVLAINGWYRAALALAVGAVVWVAILFVGRPAMTATTRATRSTHVYAAIGVVAVLAITGWNAQHASQHVLINRDGGSYATTARWIARDGSLVVHPHVGPFATDPSLKFDSFAVYQMRDGSLEFQFAHMLPVILAEAYGLDGNTGLFHAPEVLGGIALLAFYVLAWRLFRRPLFALSAMLALAFLMPQISFSRDAYSEIPSQILLFTSMWLLVTPRVLPRWRVALVAGLMLGALEAIRIDAVVFLVGVPVVFAIAFLRTGIAQERRATIASIVAFTAGLVPGLLLGWVDLARHSGQYYGDLASQIHSLKLAVVASVIASAALVAAWPALVKFLRRLPWLAIANGAAVVVALGGVFAWIVRPRVQHTRGLAEGLVAGLQAAEHVAVDPTRNYYERSMIWMAWYLGPLTVAVAIIAAALLARQLLLGRMSRTLGVLLLLGPGSALYLYKANAFSDHIWVTRRFLVSSFPLLILLALGLAAACFGIDPTRRGAMVWRVGAVLFAIAAVAYPLYTVRNVRSMTEERGYLTVVQEACNKLGDHAAVVLLEHDPSDLYDDWLPQTLRSFCGAEVGVARGAANLADLRQLAGAWNAQGRDLYVVAKSPDVIQKLMPGVPVAATRVVVNPDFLELTLTHRPGRYSPQKFALAVARVPTG